MIMFRTSIAAAALVLVAAGAATPALAGPYGHNDRSPGYGGYDRAYEADDANRLVVDEYSGRVTVNEAKGEHCAPRGRVSEWNDDGYDRRAPRDRRYGNGYRD
jgi:hypothetical protein